MADPTAGANIALPKRRFGVRDLWRVALWGLSAGAALSVTIFAASTEIGRHRTKMAFAGIHEILMPSSVKPVPPFSAKEGRRLAETVRVLAADRDRLVARIATLERGLDDATGAIAKMKDAVEEARTKSSEPPPVDVATPETKAPEPETKASEDVTSSITPANVPQPKAEPPVPAKPQFAIDLGTAGSIEELRTAWIILQRRHGSLLRGLTPAVHEGPRPGRLQFHLLAGPLSSASEAAKLCASITISGGLCTPAAFDGQRLAVR